MKKADLTTHEIEKREERSHILLPPQLQREREGGGQRQATEMEAIDEEKYDDEDDKQTTATSAATIARGKGQTKMTKGSHKPRKVADTAATSVIHYHGD
eukprot:5358072-Amphidinium_carterae.1